MRRFIVFWGLLLCVMLNLKASDPIVFVHHPKNETGQGHRDQTYLPTADYENNVINVYVPSAIEGMQVVIKDEYGVILYSTVIPYVSSLFSIVLPDEENADKYSIELFYDGWHLIGYF